VFPSKNISISSLVNRLLSLFSEYNSSPDFKGVVQASTLLFQYSLTRNSGKSNFPSTSNPERNLVTPM
jgi:hypothetical protein